MVALRQAQGQEQAKRVEWQGWDSNPRMEAYEASALDRLATLRQKNGTASRCCPERSEFWRLARASWRPPFDFIFKKFIRSAGIAPASPDWHSGILLLNDDRKRDTAEIVGCAHLTKKNEHHCPRTSSGRTRWNFHGGLSVFQAHLPFSL